MRGCGVDAHELGVEFCEAGLAVVVEDEDGVDHCGGLRRSWSSRESRVSDVKVLVGGECGGGKR